MRAVVRRLAIIIAIPITLMLAGFGLLQTGAGQDWLAGVIARAVSRPGFFVTIEGLRGVVPFRTTVVRIEVRDSNGGWLTVRGAALDLAAGDLLAGRLHIRLLELAEIDMARRPSSSRSSAPVSEYLRVPHLPLAVVLDRLAITHLALAPAVLGESVVATIKGNAEVEDGTARADLDLHRIDGTPGKLALKLALTGTKPVLSLRLDASEPTGVLLDRWLGRTHRLPLALSLAGTGPLAGWHGQLTASAGRDARLDADIALAMTSETVFGLSGTAVVAPLLPADLASAVGDRATFSLHAESREPIVVGRLALGIAAGTIAGDSSFDKSNGAIIAHLRTSVPELASLSGVLGTPLHGAASLNIGVTGNQNRPIVKADLSGAGIGVSHSETEHIEAHVSAAPIGPLDNATTRIAATAKGRIDGLAVPGAGALAQRLGSGIDWSFTATADRDARVIDVTRFLAQGGGLDLNGSGHLAASRRTFAATVDFAGSAVGVRTGIAAADALLGSKAAFAGAISRDQAGIVAVDHFALDGAAAKLAGNARFDPAGRDLTAALAFDVPQLRPLSAALGRAIAGTVSARVKAEGPIDRLRLDAKVQGSGIAAGKAKVERLQLSAAVADLSQPKAAIDGTFRAAGLDGTLAFAAERNGKSELIVPRLRMTAADSAIEGNLRIALATGLVQGSLTGRLPDLTRWSGLAGAPLGGSFDWSAKLAAQGDRQDLELTATGTRLTAGTRGSRAEIGRLALSARLADIRRMPSGTARLSLNSARLGGTEFNSATATVDSSRPGRFVFQGSADGHPLSLAFAGEAGVVPNGAQLRLTRLTGSLGGDRIALEQPLSLSRRGADLALSGLDVQLAGGRITGDAAVRGEMLSLTLNAADLPLATGARLLGHPGVHGTVSLAAGATGTLRAPQGRLVLSARNLAVSVSKHTQAAGLGLTVEGDWNGRGVDLRGRVTGLKGDTVGFSGSVPLLLTPAPLGISVPPQGRLALQLEGSGELGHLADLLPIGEDRISGRFAADVAVDGTVASPAARGHLQLTGGRYENFTTGAVLTNIQADLVGDRDRFRLASFSAGDGASGTLTAQGSLVLDGASGPTAELSAALADFRLAARDEAVATVSGTVSVSGPLAAPKIVAPLTVGHAEINLPDSLPPTVVVLHVTEIGGKSAKAPAPPANTAPALSAALDITINMPGQVVVRGHGLNSDWHGHLKITGTTTAPEIAGTLVASRGNVDLLGKSFLLTRGTITFDGSAKLDPALDIVAEASAADITAQVIITGFASKPKITLASTPPVPQDEILSRVLFNQGVGQITAGEGIQLAQAAATLAGGGPGVLDRLRGKLGLDWLGFGQGPAGAARSILNPSVTPNSASTGTAVSAGKYVAPGVSIGVTQGVSPPTSKVTVEVDVGRHVTVDTEAGQNGGTGVGLNYKYDY
jgi:translocation and assembly module TamB